MCGLKIKRAILENFSPKGYGFAQATGQSAVGGGEIIKIGNFLQKKLNKAGIFYR
ncbi:hypothetical protein HPC37_02195 [Pasteurellaceae bacterium 20609_3]|uniref:hypothetical protein n=1 Tax=Spirabiliibacterium mucosae TaxID=28156 RepID=UPI001AAD70AD|nr:hypothetical protein [Spirabiliibacterium mucosae]MBE2897677.1 hypothetical protein [Spirabiliibacterium mucosae]